MSGPLPFALALLAVAALILLTRVLGFRRQGTLGGTEEAEALAQSLPGGFLPVRITIAHGGDGALLCDGAGRVAVVAAVGAHFLVRMADKSWAVHQVSDGRLAVAGGDFSCQLQLGNAHDEWFATLRNILSEPT